MNKYAMNQEKINNPYDCIISWQVNQVCNFMCVYCDPSLNSTNQNNRYSDRIEQFFMNTNKTYLICMTGGEPFLYPRYVELCEKLTNKHYIGIFTNLTSNRVYDFTERIDPERVDFISCSVHIEERERVGGVEDFINKFSLLRRKGFNVTATIIVYPTVLEQFTELYSFFKRHDITLLTQNFQGYFRGKHYPQGYTRKERDKINLYSKLSESEMQRVKTYYGPGILGVELMHGFYSWKGLPCKAGKDFIKLEYDGTFTRCLTDKENLGSVTTGELRLHKKSKICNAEICKCPYHGLKFAIGKPKILLEKDVVREFMLYRLIKSYVKPIANKSPAAKRIFRNIKKITVDKS